MEAAAHLYLVRPRPVGAMFFIESKLYAPHFDPTASVIDYLKERAPVKEYSI